MRRFFPEKIHDTTNDTQCSLLVLDLLGVCIIVTIGYYRATECAIPEKDKDEQRNELSKDLQTNPRKKHDGGVIFKEIRQLTGFFCARFGSIKASTCTRKVVTVEKTKQFVSRPITTVYYSDVIEQRTNIQTYRKSSRPINANVPIIILA